MPSRQALILAAAGDPFIGAALGLLPKVGKVFGKVIGKAKGRGIVRPPVTSTGLIPTASPGTGLMRPSRSAMVAQAGFGIPTGAFDIATRGPMAFAGLPGKLFPAAFQAGQKLRQKISGPAARTMAMPGMRRGRRMRATNPKALRRALRRVEAFGRFARRVITIQTGKRPRIRFKTPKRRAR